MKEKEKWIHVRFKGVFYSNSTHCHTLKNLCKYITLKEAVLQNGGDVLTNDHNSLSVCSGREYDY